MAEQPESARFRALFDNALQDYHKQTGIELSKDSEHPLAVQLQILHSEDDITNLLHNQAKAFDTIRENDRILKAIKAIVSVLTPLSVAASLADDVGLVCQRMRWRVPHLSHFFQIFPPVKAVQFGLGVLLNVCALLWFKNVDIVVTSK